MNVVVGSPIPVPKIESPTNEQVCKAWCLLFVYNQLICLLFIQVHEYHAKYIAALQKLYDEYNPKYGNPNIELAIG